MGDNEPLLQGDRYDDSLLLDGIPREIDDVVTTQTKEKKGLTLHLAFAVIACIIGSPFQFGYNTGVVNTAEIVIREFINDTQFNRTGSYMGHSEANLLWAIIVAIFAVGGMIGGSSAGYFANKFGRKKALLLNNILAVIGAIFLGSSKVAKSYEMLIVGRFIVGLNSGINTGVAPMYLAEIAPTSYRGLCGTLNQFAITLAIMISQILGLKSILGTEHSWPILLGLTALPVLFQLLTLTFCVESPRYLMLTKHSEEEAERALVWLRGTSDVAEEIDEMRKEDDTLQKEKKFAVLDLFRDPSLRQPIIISLVMQLSQQFSGINAAIYYSTSIFISAGLTSTLAQYATIASGGVNVAMTFGSAFIMDRLGRRTLHLTGLVGMLLFSTLLTYGLVFQHQIPELRYISVVSVILYIASFGLGPGSIPWFIVAELFSQGPRAAAMSIAVPVNWFANFIVGLVFPLLQDAITYYSFVPFIGALIIFIVFTYFKVPETKGRTIEDITAMFKSRSARNIQTESEFRRATGGYAIE